LKKEKTENNKKFFLRKIKERRKKSFHNFLLKRLHSILPLKANLLSVKVKFPSKTKEKDKKAIEQHYPQNRFWKISLRKG
jgi:hypothetical protein